MLTSAPGSKPRRGAGRPASAAARGFTLIELLVVLALVAVATALVGMSLRDPTQAQLEREAERLTALLETARAEARASGLAVQWTPQGRDADAHFRFDGLPAQAALPTRWLAEAPAVELDGGARSLQLGPEPLLPAQGLQLRLGDQRLHIASDGLRPFEVQR